MLQLLFLIFVVIAIYNFGGSLLSVLKNSTNKERGKEMNLSENEESSNDYDGRISQLKRELENEIDNENFARAYLKLAQLDSVISNKYKRDTEEASELEAKSYSLAKRAAKIISSGIDGFKNGFK